MYRQFNYLSYLQNKYGVDAPSTMLQVEAKMMGLKYPLVSGWRDKHKDWLTRDLTVGEAESFLAGLIRKKKDTLRALENFKGKPEEKGSLSSRLKSLQTGIDFIIGRDFTPLSHDDKRLIKEELEG